MTRMKPAVFRMFLDRDHQRCIDCGTTEGLVPGHRINRQMGGSKRREVASNVVVMCSRLNHLVESDAAEAARAKRYGWKLESWQNPATEPVYDATLGAWFTLDDQYRRVPCVGTVRGAQAAVGGA